MTDGGRREPGSARGSPELPAGSTLAAVLGEARRRGFLGPAAIDSQVAHARGFLGGWEGPPPGRIADLGSGGGLPALVLAMVWPASRWLLVEANQRRAEFLVDAALVLGLDAVNVVADRAEVVGRDTQHRAGFDLVTARGFGAPAVTAECAAPLLRVGGRLIVSEPPDDVDALRWPPDVAEVGLRVVRRYRRTYAYVVLEQVTECAARYPRRVGVPAKRPLF